ncbi:MAG: NAD(P)-binding domain-containing protein [Gammaproteobacteria bacterium]|jgi:cation diffusion facilitator CzcD-associated flavoprotein CzcO
MNTTAVIGAGPAGLAAAKYLKQHGLAPTVFEQGDSVGGQWCGGAPYSGVWPNMFTNTSRLMTAFSDFPHRDERPVYATNQHMHAYLQAYARHFGLESDLRLSTRVVGLERTPSADGWQLTYQTGAEPERTETFDRVAIASGRYHKPRIPDVPGLDSFTGEGGVSHTFDYRGPAAYRGMNVLVAGGSISALEIASDLAAQSAGAVISSQRRQRYVLSKLIAGVPVEHLAFNRFGALANESFPLDDVAREMKHFIVSTCGRPDQYGALAAPDSVLEAGITQSQNFLPFVAEGRIIAKPWIRGVRGRQVVFTDGTSLDVDALIFGTGFALDLPFLADSLTQPLALDQEHIDLHAHTLHPDLPGLAFLGLYDIVGPAYPVLELQARWITYLWSGQRPMPADEEMRAGIEAYQAARHLPQSVPMHLLAIQFARLAGVEPRLDEFPQLARELLFGPLCPISFRLSGPDALADAADGVAAAAALSGAVPEPDLAPEHTGQIQALASARGDGELTRLLGALESVRRWRAAPDAGSAAGRP